MAIVVLFLISSGRELQSRDAIKTVVSRPMDLHTRSEALSSLTDLIRFYLLMSIAPGRGSAWSNPRGRAVTKNIAPDSAWSNPRWWAVTKANA